MRGMVLFLLLAATAGPGFAAKRITVAQLEEEVRALQGKPDAKAAAQLADLELTERLSAAKYAAFEGQVPGAKARQALLVLADVSAFLDLPVGEVPQMAAPDFAAQQQMLNQAIRYVARTVRQLPNFSASRVTTRFRDIAGDTSYTSDSSQGLRLVGVSTQPVTFRDGQEAPVATASKSEAPAMDGLSTRGEFGPILFTVLLDLAHSTVKWKQWEERPGKPLAVFSFYVPRAQSHYQVGGQQVSSYHGVIAIDPDAGTVIRIVVQADLTPADSFSRADILVEYGPVDIGGRSYICPVKSVAVLVHPVAVAPSAGSFRNGQISSTTTAQYLPRPMQTQLDDVAFTQYHVFRADSRIVAVDGGGDAPR
jgi:hypothetical protein